MHTFSQAAAMPDVDVTKAQPYDDARTAAAAHRTSTLVEEGTKRCSPSSNEILFSAETVATLHKRHD